MRRRSEPSPESQQILSTEALSEEESKILFDSYAPEETDFSMQAADDLRWLRRLVCDCAVEILAGLIFLLGGLERLHFFGWSELICGSAAAVVVCIGFSISKKRSAQRPSVSYCVLAARILVILPLLLLFIRLICSI